MDELLSKLASEHTKRMREIQERATSNTQQAAQGLVEFVEAPWLYADTLIKRFIEHIENQEKKTQGGARKND